MTLTTGIGQAIMIAAGRGCPPAGCAGAGSTTQPACDGAEVLIKQGGKVRPTRMESFAAQVRSGQVRFITRPKSRTMRAKRKINVLELTERGAEMSNELESDRAMGG